MVTSLLGVHGWGQDGEGEPLFAVDTPDPWKELKQLFSTSEK